MIIVEGPDLAGKTTFCEELVKELNFNRNQAWVYQHMTRLPPAWNYHRDYMKLYSDNVIMDRFHMSEPAYASARGDQSGLDHLAYQMLDGELISRGAVQVVIIPSDEVIRARWGRDEMYTLDTVLACAAKYREFVQSRTKWFDYAITVNEPEIDLSREVKLVADLKERKQHYVSKTR